MGEQELNATLNEAFPMGVAAFIFGTANEAAMDFVAAKTTRNPDSLYATWTQHVGTCSNVCSAFNDRLAEMGVGGGRAQQQYLHRFFAAHGIGDNYFE